MGRLRLTDGPLFGYGRALSVGFGLSVAPPTRAVRRTRGQQAFPHRAAALGHRRSHFGYAYALTADPPLRSGIVHRIFTGNRRRLVAGHMTIAKPCAYGGMPDGNRTPCVARACQKDPRPVGQVERSTARYRESNGNVGSAHRGAAASYRTLRCAGRRRRGTFCR
jgi:hypothetical protein